MFPGFKSLKQHPEHGRCSKKISPLGQCIGPHPAILLNEGQTLQVGKPRGHLTLPHTESSPSRARKTDENPIPYPQEFTLRLQHTV